MSTIKANVPQVKAENSTGTYNLGNLVVIRMDQYEQYKGNIGVANFNNVLGCYMDILGFEYDKGGNFLEYHPVFSQVLNQQEKISVLSVKLNTNNGGINTNTPNITPDKTKGFYVNAKGFVLFHPDSELIAKETLGYGFKINQDNYMDIIGNIYNPNGHYIGYSPMHNLLVPQSIRQIMVEYGKRITQNTNTNNSGVGGIWNNNTNNNNNNNTGGTIWDIVNANTNTNNSTGSIWGNGGNNNINNNSGGGTIWGGDKIVSASANTNNGGRAIWGNGGNTNNNNTNNNSGGGAIWGSGGNTSPISESPKVNAEAYDYMCHDAFDDDAVISKEKVGTNGVLMDNLKGFGGTVEASSFGSSRGLVEDLVGSNTTSTNNSQMENMKSELERMKQLVKQASRIEPSIISRSMMENLPVKQTNPDINPFTKPTLVKKKAIKTSLDNLDSVIDGGVDGKLIVRPAFITIKVRSEIDPMTLIMGHTNGSNRGFGRKLNDLISRVVVAEGIRNGRAPSINDMHKYLYNLHMANSVDELALYENIMHKLKSMTSREIEKGIWEVSAKMVVANLTYMYNPEIATLNYGSEFSEVEGDIKTIVQMISKRFGLVGQGIPITLFVGSIEIEIGLKEDHVLVRRVY